MEEVRHRPSRSLIGNCWPSFVTATNAACGAFSQLVTDLRDALEVLEQKIITERQVASREICKKLGGTHKAMVAAIAGKMSELNTLANEYRAFVDELQRNDIATAALNLINTRYIREALATSYRDAREAGHLAASAIPEDLRQ